MKDALKIFLSHNSNDKPFVRELAKDLTSQGFSVWLDEWEIRAGDSISDKIQLGLKQADIVVIVLTPNSIKSPWVKDELRMSFQKRIKKRKSFSIIPVLLRKCEIPGFLSDYLYITFENKRKYKESFTRLIDSIIFSDQFSGKFKSTYAGGFIVDSIEITATFSKNSVEEIHFSEKYLITPIKRIKGINKKFEFDGNIDQVLLSNGKVKRKEISKTSESWRMQFDSELLPRVKYSFVIDYYLSGDDELTDRWFYTIDSPTRELSFKYEFLKKHKFPKKFNMKLMQTQTCLESKDISSIKYKSKAVYKYKIKFPSYKDWIDFSWKY